MRSRERKFRSASLPAILLGIMLAAGGCTSVQLVSNYDETIDKEAQQLQKKLDTHFITLQGADTETLKYKTQQPFYAEVLADLNAMEIRAGGIYKNHLTMEQIALAKENLAYLVLMNKQCITAPLSEAQKQKVKANGIDLSTECRVEYGASSDLSDRGDVALTRFVVPPVQSLFNQHMGAIMALELAKKRGDTTTKE